MCPLPTPPRVGPPALSAVEELMVGLTCKCGCGERIPERTRRGRPRVWASPRCFQRARVRRPEVRARRSLQRALRRNEVTGRVCKWCQRTDDRTAWSNVPTECCRCARGKYRNLCPDCSGPLVWRVCVARCGYSAPALFCQWCGAPQPCRPCRRQINRGRSCGTCGGPKYTMTSASRQWLGCPSGCEETG